MSEEFRTTAKAAAGAPTRGLFASAAGNRELFPKCSLTRTEYPLHSCLHELRQSGRPGADSIAASSMIILALELAQ